MINNKNNNITCPECKHEFAIERGFAISNEAEVQRLVDVQLEEALAAQQIKIESDNAIEKKDMDNKLQELSNNNEKLQADLLKLLASKRESDQKVKDADLMIEKQLNERLEKSEIELAEKMEKKYESRLAQKDKKLSDLDKQLADTQNRLHQGSQQLQGETAEVTIEHFLSTKFHTDTIEEIPKGKRGADCVQVVCNEMMQQVGRIVIESKDTKDWSNSWIEKVKSDQKLVNADLAVIVTRAKPKKNPVDYQMIEGVFVIDGRLLEPTISILRQMLMEVAFTKNANDSIETRTETLWKYITSPAFRNLIENTIGTWKELYNEVGLEKAAMEKKWKRREILLQRIIDNTAATYANVKVMVGGDLEDIPEMELESYQETLALKEG